MQPTSASSTDNGKAVPANWIEKRIENAIAAPGAMCVIDWNSTCASPIEPSRSRSVPPSLEVAASIKSSSRGDYVPIVAKCAGWRSAIGGFDGIPLVAGVRCSFRGKDAGSVRSSALRARPRTPPRSEQRGPAAQTVFRQTLLLTPGRRVVHPPPADHGRDDLRVE